VILHYVVLASLPIGFPREADSQLQSDCVDDRFLLLESSNSVILIILGYIENILKAESVVLVNSFWIERVERKKRSF
jgi:hypothetical protein